MPIQQRFFRSESNAYTLIELLVAVGVLFVLVGASFATLRPVLRFMSNSLAFYQAYNQLQNIQDQIKLDVESASAVACSESALGLVQEGKLVFYLREGNDLYYKKEQKIKLNTEVIHFLDFSATSSGGTVTLHIYYQINGGKLKHLEDAYHAWNAQ